MQEYEKLKELAEAATGGKWFSDAQFVMVWQGGDDLVATTHVESGQQGENAEFIAAACPSIVLEMIAEIESLNAQNSDLRLQCGGMEMTIDELKGERDSMQRVGISAQDSLTIAQAALEHLEGYCMGALPGVQFMDQPDGGDVALGEQVKRMGADWLKVTKERDSLREVLKLLAPDLKAMAILYAQTRQHERSQALNKICKSVGVV